MIHRRDAMLRLGALGVGGLALPNLLRAKTVAPRRASAESCISLFLWGGPPQQDTFDLKPTAPAEFRGEFKPIPTNVPGIEISEHLPRLARNADKFTIVRSLSHSSNNHEPSVYHMMTGRPMVPELSVPRNQRRRSDFPHLGSVVAAMTPPTDVPASVTVPRPIGHDGVTYAGTYAGFLGPKYDPFEKVAAPNPGDMAAHAMDPFPELPEPRMAARHGLLRSLEVADRRIQKSAGMRDLDEFRDRAMRMITSAAARQAFELDREPPAIRDRYGRDEYGESFLLARRLVEAGVKCITITWMYIFPGGRVSNVWDNHAGYGIHGAKTGFDLLRGPVCLQPLDRGLSALLEDLADRGLLDTTLIAAAGEFGRTPTVNKDSGRDHWGACQSAFLAGGGIRGGQVYGASDSRGAYPKEQPVAPADFLATLYHGMGIDPQAEIHDREQRPHRICDGQPLTQLFG